jgi:hypothetical protein
MPTPDWVIVYRGGAADTAVLHDVLVAAGIEAQLRDEVMGTLAPYIVAGGATAGVKVVVPEDRLEEARAIVEDFTARERGASQPGTPSFRPWECPCCHERNDGTFDICWNCQTERADDGR